MSSNNNKDNMTAKNIIKQMPAALQQHLRDPNIQDVDENSVAEKLQDHLSAICQSVLLVYTTREITKQKKVYKILDVC
jgi:hypothetical protein